jgi:alkyldihydroxyacetonephosphate synthase
LLQLLIGSEGTLGLITQATCTIHPLPELRRYRGWRFAGLERGCDALRGLLHAGLRPAVVRLYDPLDSLLHQRSTAAPGDPVEEREVEPGGGAFGAASGAFMDTVLATLKRRALGAALAQPRALNWGLEAALSRWAGGCLLIVGFEGPARRTEAEAAAAEELLVRAGGHDLGEGPGAHWLATRYDVSFGMSRVFHAGAFVDTMEVATTWDRLLPLYRAVREAIGGLAFVMAHFSHAYVDGCSIYFTFAASGPTPTEAQRRYDRIWGAGLSAVNATGGTISHHHGIGLSKAPFMPAEHGEGMRIYRALKAVLDPHGIMNPGKMGL